MLPPREHGKPAQQGDPSNNFLDSGGGIAGFVLAAGENVPNKMGMMVTTGFMGALLGFLGIMFTLRELRRTTSFSLPANVSFADGFSHRSTPILS